MERLEREGFERKIWENEGSRGLSLLSLTKETFNMFRFHIVTCSCIVELREAVTISWISPPQTGILRGVSVHSVNFYGQDVGAPVLRFNKLKKGSVAQPKPINTQYLPRLRQQNFTYG